MFLVFLTFAALAFGIYQTIFKGFRIGNNFFLTIAVIGVAFLVLFILSIRRLGKPTKKQRQAMAQAAANRAAADRATVAASNSGSFSFRAAGTTFRNNDGTSRQDILRHLRFGDSPWADDPEDLLGTLEDTIVNGEPAIAVLVNGYQVGFVPKSHIGKVSDAMTHASTFFVSGVNIIGGGKAPDGTKLSYGCEITINY